MRCFYQQCGTTLRRRSFIEPSEYENVLDEVSGFTRDQVEIIAKVVNQAYVQGHVDGEHNVKYCVKKALGLL